MGSILIILITILPVFELIVIIKVGQAIGAINTVFLLIATGLIGAFLARLQGFLVLQKIQDNLDKGIMPAEEMLDGLLIFCGGILLMIPGFITDVFGIILLVPFLRMLVKILLRKWIAHKIQNGETVTFYRSSPNHPKLKPKDFEDADFH